MVDLDRGPDYIKRVEGLHKASQRLANPLDRMVSTYYTARYLRILKRREAIQSLGVAIHGPLP